VTYVHTLIDARPPARADSEPWTSVRVEQATEREGPFTTADTIALSPTDADPMDPAARDLTFDSTLATGWFRLVFVDADLNEAPPTEPVLDDGQDDRILADVIEVASFLRARTRDQFGNEVGTFNANTRPTESQVVSLIRLAADHVTATVGTRELPAGLMRMARTAVALRAAMLVELSYFPEQVQAGRSPYEQLRAMYDAELVRVERAARDASRGDLDVGIIDDARLPRYRVPDRSAASAFPMTTWETEW
jgi:hypothetical protein